MSLGFTSMRGSTNEWAGSVPFSQSCRRSAPIEQGEHQGQDDREHHAPDDRDIPSEEELQDRQHEHKNRKTPQPTHGHLPVDATATEGHQDERWATPLRRTVRAEGLEPPQACAHQVLSLARLPNSATPAWLSRVLRSDTGVVSSAQEPRRVGGSRGNRTHNPRIKSPMLCLIELATHREVIRRIGEGAMAVFARSRSRPWSVSSSRWSDARGSDRRHAGDDSCDGLCRLAW